METAEIWPYPARGFDIQKVKGRFHLPEPAAS